MTLVDMRDWVRRRVRRRTTRSSAGTTEAPVRDQGGIPACQSEDGSPPDLGPSIDEPSPGRALTKAGDGHPQAGDPAANSPIRSQAERSLEQIIEDNFRDVHQEECDRLPPDLTDRLDHYLHGTDLHGTDR